MLISEIKIDNDFASCLPKLAKEEYTELEKNIVKHGVKSPLLTWHGYLVDGHNRMQICIAHGIKEVKTEEMDKLENKEDVVMWILKNQLGRRNLNDYQRGQIALRYEEMIKERMKERQVQAGKDFGRGDKGGAQSGTSFQKSKTRDELAKIAGVSHSTMDRIKNIVKNGTEEQKERAQTGGKGNSPYAIDLEIKQAAEPMVICEMCGKPVPKNESVIFGNEKRTRCKKCHRAAGKACDEKGPDIKHIEQAIERISDQNKEIVYTKEMMLNEYKWAADNLKLAWDQIGKEHEELSNDETILADAFRYLENLFKEDERYVKFL